MLDFINEKDEATKKLLVKIVKAHFTKISHGQNLRNNMHRWIKEAVSTEEGR